MDQTARLNLLNDEVPNGIIVTWRFIDASGVVLMKPQEQLFLPFGKIVSVDFKRHRDPLPKTDPAGQLRAEVRAQIDSNSGSPAKAFAEVWKYSTTIPARPPCAWAVRPHKQAQALKD
jgi:hypothetical protein